MSKHAMEASFDNIEENLNELIANFLDSEAVVLDEAIGLISDPEKRENTELHVRMAKAAMNEYKKTVVYRGLENPKTQSLPIISEKEHKKAQEIFVLLVAGNMSLTEINTLTENERMLLSNAFVEKLKQ